MAARGDGEGASEALRKQVEEEDRTMPSLGQPTHQATIVRPRTYTDKQHEMVTDVLLILTCRVRTGATSAPESCAPQARPPGQETTTLEVVSWPKRYRAETG